MSMALDRGRRWSGGGDGSPRTALGKMKAGN